MDIVNIYEYWQRKYDLVEYKYTRRGKANEESRKSLTGSKSPIVPGSMSSNHDIIQTPNGHSGNIVFANCR